MKTYIEQCFILLEKEFNRVSWFTKGKGTRDRLVKSLSQTKEEPYKYLGYSSAQGLTHAFYKPYPELRDIKDGTSKWRNFLLGRYLNKFLCFSCNEVLNLDTKLEGSKFICKSCKKDKDLVNRKRIYNYCLKHPCVDCGETDPIVLEFDHIDPKNKLFNIGDSTRKSWDVIKKEINKCDVVCANCHRRRTAKQQNWYQW